MVRIHSLLVACALAASATPVSAQPAVGQDLKRLTLEELLRVEVSTALRVPEPTSDIPAAVTVLTADEIRRSGATTLAEALRLAPGVQVAQLDAARYAIGVRGFADRLSRSMLVMIDGRAVYSPLFAGTYWEVQDTLLEDVDRIEIIRGPGGTLWGANAVNGIVNIITRRAEDTQGTLVTGALGPDLQGPFGLRYGGRLGSDFHFRAYLKATDRDPFDVSASSGYDVSTTVQGGFRGDWALSGARTLTLQGDVYGMDLGQRYNTLLAAPPYAQVLTRTAPLSGGNVLARWVVPAATGEYQLQTYYDRTSRDERPVAETRDTVDLDFQHVWGVSTRHRLVWGTGFRASNGRITATAPTAFVPSNRTDLLFTGFAQDDVTLVRDRVHLIGGAKVEHNRYSGFELQPGVRAMWTINRSNAMFSAVTRAVRTPSRVETDYTTTSLANPAIPAFVMLQPNDRFVPEKLTAYELGYRVRPAGSLYVTSALFFNRLEDILSTELRPAYVVVDPPPARLMLPVTFANGLHGNSHGAEVSADFRPLSWWRWTGNYSLVRIQMTPDPGSRDVSQQRRNEGLSPRHQVQVQSWIDGPHNVSFDWLFRYASRLPAGPVPAYATSNVRVAWRLSPYLELALVGQNLHQPRHVEWPSGSSGNVEIPRSAYVSVVWRR